MLALAEPVPQERLSQIANWLNEIAEGQDGQAIANLVAQRDDALEQDILRLWLLRAV